MTDLIEVFSHRLLKLYFYNYYSWLTLISSPKYLIGGCGVYAAVLLFFGVAASIGFLCIFSAYIIASPSVVSLFEYSVIIMSMIPGYFLFNEIPSLRTLLGVICIISAGVYIYFREGVRKQYVASKIPTRR